MPRVLPWQQRTVTRRTVVVTVTLAVAVHVGVLTWISTRDTGSGARAPDIQGVGEKGVGGLPNTGRRNLHAFRIVDADSDDAPLAGAVVRDVLGEQEALSHDDGNAYLAVRPAAKLLLRVEKPGFALHTEQFGNNSLEASNTVHMQRADVPYFIVDTILLQRCNYCHGGSGKTEGVDLTTYEKVMASRWQKIPIVIPGKPEASWLVRVLNDSVDADGKHTPHGRVTTRVPPIEVEWLTEWVRQGARRVGPP